MPPASRAPGCRSSSIPARFRACRSRGRRSRSSCTVRTSRACICARAPSPAAASAGRSGRRISAPRSSGLMKAQHVKNTVIVPVGAKGGFVARRLPPRAPREQQQREVIECYRSFIRGLLDLTDNIVGGRVSAAAAGAPAGWRRSLPGGRGRQGHRHFLRHRQRDLGRIRLLARRCIRLRRLGRLRPQEDGRSPRAARWECVKRHFRELGRDIQREPFTRRRHRRHVRRRVRQRHAAVARRSGWWRRSITSTSSSIRIRTRQRSLRERQRLFRLPRSGWNDYDRAAAVARRRRSTSAAPRASRCRAKRRRCSTCRSARASPVEIIRAILCMRVDLLWNGGIGTYVKASSERHGEIGDRANDAVRVDGRAGARARGRRGRQPRLLAARPHRVRRRRRPHQRRFHRQFRRRQHLGRRSQSEDPAGCARCRRADCRAARRNRLLAAATDEVAAAGPAQQLPAEPGHQPDGAARASRTWASISSCCAGSSATANSIARSSSCPTDEEIEQRRREGRGLTRPELALLLAVRQDRAQPRAHRERQRR